MPLSGFMSNPVISIQSGSSIREAMQLMSSKQIRRLVEFTEDLLIIWSIPFQNYNRLIESDVITSSII